jgi:TolA-binding protein
MRIAAGQYAQVLQEAEFRGTANVLATASRSELMALADAARYSKQSDLAERTLKTIRTRFPGSKDGAAAAFLLGRLLEGHDPSGAKQLYLAATQEDPHGPFRSEILGRQLLLSDRTGDHAAAKRAAAEYVKFFPKGPYAGKARLLSTP